MIDKAIDILPRAIMVGVAASITVGPVAIMTIQRTLSRGRDAGIYSALGVSTVDTILATVSYLFYSLISKQLTDYSFILRIVGGIIVGCIGLSIISGNPVAKIRKSARSGSSPWRDFISTAGLTFANFIAVVPYILAFFALCHIKPIEHITKEEDVINSVLVIGGFLIGSLMWWMALVFGVNSLRDKFQLRHLVVVNRVAGALILLLGICTIISTFIG